MTTRFGLLMILLCYGAQTLASGPADSSLESKIHFAYASTDGEFALECKHWIANPGAGDFAVICGKGTPTVKQFSVHLVIREFIHSTSTSFEIIFGVTDRNTLKPVPGFSSHSQMLTVDHQAKMQEISMSEGVENDAAQLSLRFKP